MMARDNNGVIVGYVDDDIDFNLLSYLAKKYGGRVCSIKVESNDTLDSVLKKIVENECNIVLLDSKLYKDSGSFVEKITGQNLEVVLASLFPYIYSLVISQEKDDKGLNYIEKYKGNSTDNSIVENYYKERLDSILTEYEKKQRRIVLTNRDETQKNLSIDKFLRDTIDGEI
ncbi:MAG: hypothetical protein J6Z11_01630, partial [Candidatus Riflebacteria bacterium]|nr:hypothetical protein [Candidatus Riflebacteria bacterium]